MIHICQYLCPQRHCTIGAAYEPAEVKAEKIEQDLLNVFKTGLVNPWCGICGSRELHFEHGETRFTTIEEAQGSLRAMEAANMASRMMIDEVKKRARNN
jgi:hypothetical protein